MGWGHVYGEDKILSFSTKCLAFFPREAAHLWPSIRSSTSQRSTFRRSRVAVPAGRMASPRLPGSTTRSWNSAERIGRKLSKRGVSKVWNKLALAAVLAQHRVAQCCIRAVLYHRPECRGPWTTGVCPGEHLRILPGPNANQWIVHGRGSTGPGLRWQPCRAADRFRHLGPAKGPPHHCRLSERLAGGTHPPAATAYDLHARRGTLRNRSTLVHKPCPRGA